MTEVFIRKYKSADRSAVREIAGDTAFLGKPAEAFFQDREILADILTLYFTDYEPNSCFVAEIDGQIGGYLLGAKDTAGLSKFFFLNILLELIVKIIRRRTLLKKKNFLFFFYLFVSFLKGEFKINNFSRLYPATLHINVKASFRSKGLGSILIDTYLKYLAGEKVSGLHFGTISANTVRFFEKNGFKLLYQGKRSYFQYVLPKAIDCYIMGKNDFGQ